jgi:hypothetical protein
MSEFTVQRVNIGSAVAKDLGADWLHEDRAKEVFDRDVLVVAFARVLVGATQYTL